MLKDMMESSRPMAIREEMSFIRSEITCLTNDLEKITKLKKNITIQLLTEINGDSMKKKITETSEMALQKQEIIVKSEKQVDEICYKFFINNRYILVAWVTCNLNNFEKRIPTFLQIL